MITIAELISRVKRIPDCEVYPPSGQPQLFADDVLPDDVHEFYSLCGGMILFREANYPTEVSPPERFKLSNPEILPGVSQVGLGTEREEISDYWYIVARHFATEYISIDCNPHRLGRCYYSFWDVHAMQGYSPIIALSFTEFLESLIDNEGKSRYWEEPSSVKYGDAYG